MSNVQDIKWLGVRPSDLDRFNIPKACRIKMTDEDIKTGKKMARFYQIHAIISMSFSLHEVYACIGPTLIQSHCAYTLYTTAKECLLCSLRKTS